MVVSILLGLIAGVISFSPLIVGMRLARKATSTSNLGHAGALLLGVFLSLILLVAFVAVCMFVARDQAAPFVLAEAVGLCICAAAYGVFRLVRK